MNPQQAVICITGASGGIGRALSLELARKNPAGLCIVARGEQALETLRAEIDAMGVQCLALQGDVANTEDVDQVVTKTLKHFGRLDIAIANAGTGNPVLATSPDSQAAEHIMNVNYLGAVRLFHAALPHMLKQGHGHLVGVSSLAAWRGMPRGAAYCASKAALSSFLESYRLELRPHGIIVSSVLPGVVQTSLVEKNGVHLGPRLTPERAAKYICKGIEAERSIIAFPPLNVAAMMGLKVLPPRVYDWVMRKIAGEHLKAPQDELDR